MPRIRHGLGDLPHNQFPKLTAAHVEELQADRESGQPIIYEQTLPRTNAIRVQVLWDQWEEIADEDRAAIILQAYGQVEGQEFRDRIALAIGLTIPEAVNDGILPYQVQALVRSSDPVTWEQCGQAMIDQGASLLNDPQKPELRFATQSEAEACVNRLIDALPQSQPIWTITQDSRGSRY